MEQKKSDDRFVVVVVKDGVAKEVKVPQDVAEVLEDAYDREKIVGISRSTYSAMASMLAKKVMQYEKLLAKSGEKEMFDKAIAFSRAFDIYSNESPILVEIMLWIDRNLAENPSFNSKSINARTIRNYLEGRNIKATYATLSLDFKEWAKSLFAAANLHIGFVRFAKFYYSVAVTATM